jgi:thioredoxin reductase
VTEREYDVVIIGGGPAGLAAGLYAARGRHRTVMLEKGVIGGQISLTELVENYPGVPNVNGFDLGQTMQQQAESHGMETEYVEVAGIEKTGLKWRVRTSADDFIAKAVIITSGAEYNRLGVPGEERLTGCDGRRAVHDTVRLQGARAAPPQRAAGQPYPAGPGLRQPQDGVPLEHRCRGDPRR